MRTKRGVLSAILAMAWFTGSATGATLTRHATEADFQAALGPTTTEILEDFDGFAEGTVLSDQVPGVVFSSPNAGEPGFVPVQVEYLPRAVSRPAALSGGSVDTGTVRQAVTLEFATPASGLAFWLVAQYAIAAEVAVTLDYEDGSSETVLLFPGLVEDTNQNFFGITSDVAIARATLVSNEQAGGLFQNFGGIDDLRFAVGDELPPLCAGDPQLVDGVLGIDGVGLDDRPADTGVASVALAPGSKNLSLVVDPAFMPGDPNVSFRVEAADLGLDAQGFVLVTDNAGNSCELCLNFRNLPQGPTFQELVCCYDGIVFQVSNEDQTPSGPSWCSANPLGPDDPPLPPGYEPVPDDALAQCPVLTVQSPIAGDTEMVLKVDGDYDPTLRMLFTRSDDGGNTYGSWIDVTELNEPIFDIIPDPTKLKGKTTWSPVKVTCARLAELCNGLDDDGDGLIDEGLPIAGSTNDDDMDGYFLCPEQGQGLEADCNDQNPLINPAATEICDGLDNDCDGAIDEGDPGGGEVCTVDGQVGACAAGVTECFESVVDCMQTVFPVDEVCNGVDDDCDGAVDEDFPVGGTCEVGVGACATTGTLVCNAAGDGTVCDAVPGDPADELCDGLDNDCDGAVDEDFAVGGTCEVGVGACAATGTLVCNAAGDGTACDATPGDPVDEVCDGLDNDCDGAVDNGDPGGGQSCGTTDVGACEYGVTTCSAGSLVCVGNVEPVPEACADGADNDCDGTVDEGLLPVAVCSPSQDLLNIGSQSTSFKFNLESLVNACDPASPASLDGSGITAAYISRAGDAVLSDPLSLSCPDITGSFLGERGIVEDIADRQVTGNDIDLKFNRSADGDCRTLDGTRQDLFALVSDQPNNAVVPVCFKSTFDGVEFECCMEATVRNNGNR